METIKIKYFNDKMTKIKKIEQGDWIDLRTAKEVTVIPYQQCLIPLGIAMELPDGYEAHIVPRSSTFKKYGIILTNSTGIIDNSYCGDNDQWFFSALGTRELSVKIPFNERICQFRIVKKQPSLNFIEVNKLGNKDRGGFGSTDIKE